MNDKLEKIANWFSDMDWGWWPILSWRPSKTNDFDTVLILKLTIYCGFFGSVLFAILIVATEKKICWFCFWIAIALMWLIVYFTWKYILATAWNQRAKRLRNENL